MSLLRTFAAPLAALALAGCAATEPLVMRMQASEAELGLMFPPATTQEVPRYRYLGQLVGEDNFINPNGKRSTARKLFDWLVGLGERSEDPVVLQRPQSGLVDGQGRVLVTDVSRNAVFVFDQAGGRLEVWERATPNEPFAAPIAIAAGPAGQFLVTDAQLASVIRLSPEGKPLGRFGEGVLVRPTGIVRDPQLGRIYVADTHAHDIKVFDDEGRHVATWGRRGDAPGELNYPTHLALANGLLIVCDSMNARVQALDAEGRAKMQFGERGLYVGNLVRPKGVAADDEGNIYVVESMHDTLLVFDREGRLLMSLGGTGQEPGRFYLPAGVWVDSRNRVFVADMFNGRVAVFQFLGGQ